MTESKQRDQPPARPCPICHRPAEWRYRPFCSPRCAEIDLGRWLGGTYAVPGEERPANDAEDERE